MLRITSDIYKGTIKVAIRGYELQRGYCMTVLLSRIWMNRNHSLLQTPDLQACRIHGSIQLHPKLSTTVRILSPNRGGYGKNPKVLQSGRSYLFLIASHRLWTTFWWSKRAVDWDFQKMNKTTSTLLEGVVL